MLSKLTPSTQTSTGNPTHHSVRMQTSQVINKNVEDPRPLFMYLAYQAVHVPHDVPSSNLYSEEADGWKLAGVSDWNYRRHFGKTLVALDNAISKLVNAMESSGMMVN